MHCSVITEECIARARVLTLGGVGCSSSLRAGAVGVARAGAGTGGCGDSVGWGESV